MIGEGTKVYHEYLSNLGDFNCGKDCIIHSNVWIGNGVTIGDRVRVQAFAFIPPGVEIGDDVFIGPHTCFTNDPNLEMKPNWKPTKTIIKKGAKLGANSTVLAGITIGENALIGMGSVVTKDVPDNEIWVGNPAKKLRGGL